MRANVHQPARFHTVASLESDTATELAVLGVTTAPQLVTASIVLPPAVGRGAVVG